MSGECSGVKINRIFKQLDVGRVWQVRKYYLGTFDDDEAREAAQPACIMSVMLLSMVRKYVCNGTGRADEVKRATRARVHAATTASAPVAQKAYCMKLLPIIFWQRSFELSLWR